MINVEFNNEDIKHNVFEFLRITFPSYELYNDLNVKIIEEDNYLIKVSCENFNKSFYAKKVKDKREQKYIIKQQLYKNLEEFFEFKDSWGILTGIRPVKLVIKLLEKFSEQETEEILKNYYLLSDDSIKTAINIARREQKIIYPLDKNRYSLYIHIPFCPSKCSYCSFLTMSNKSENTEIYIKTLIEELKSESDKIQKAPRTIYIGGGTPTAVKIEELEKVIKTVKSYYGLSDEFTVECGRPDTINKDVLSMLYENKVNRISINPQTMNDKTLNLIGRNHSVEDIINTYYDARKIGFNCINMDLILGLPDESKSDVIKSLNDVIELKPENITIHTLAVKNGSKLYESKYNNIKESNDILKATKEITFRNKYNPYYMYRQKRMMGNGENIGYAIDGFESVYNIIMMEEKESVLGFGMCSTTKFFYPEEDRIEKIMQYRNLKDYVENFGKVNKKKDKYFVDFEF